MTLETEVEAGASGYSVTGGGSRGIFVKQVLKGSSAAKLFSLREGAVAARPPRAPPFPIMTGGPERAGPHGSSGGPPARLGSLPPKTPRGGRGRGHALATPITAATGWGWGGGELRLRPTLSVQVTSCSVQLCSLMTLNTKTL